MDTAAYTAYYAARHRNEKLAEELIPALREMYPQYEELDRIIIRATMDKVISDDEKAALKEYIRDHGLK